MTRFVWVPVKNGGDVPVNPDQVKYMRRTVEGDTALVFGALNGGFDQVAVSCSAEEAVELLGGEPKPAAKPAPKPRAKRASKAT